MGIFLNTMDSEYREKVEAALVNYSIRKISDSKSLKASPRCDI